MEVVQGVSKSHVLWISGAVTVALDWAAIESADVRGREGPKKDF